MSGAANHIISKLLGRQGRIRIAVATTVLFTGIFLLLISVLVWWNFSLLVAGESRKTTSSFLVVAKTITDRNMGADNLFSASEIEKLRTAPSVTDIAAVTPACFPAYATMGGAMAMSTDLPLEAVDDRFLDTLPPGWSWRPGQRDLPVIVSSQFFDIYNYVFAPSQGLPQLSYKSVTMLTLKLSVGGQAGDSYNAHVVGFTHRFGSVLVPQSFIEFGNRRYAASSTSRPLQVVLEVADPTNAALNQFLLQNGYSTNPQNLRWSKLQGMVNMTTTGFGIIALLLVGISGLVFNLFIQLTLARAGESLALLRQLGYSATFLGRSVNKRIFPLVFLAIGMAGVAGLLIQAFLSIMVSKIGLDLPSVPGWPIWLILFVAGTLLLQWLTSTTKKTIRG